MKPESMLKGWMAETLVEELLRQSGNAVYRFGYEAIVQNLAQPASSFDHYSEVKVLGGKNYFHKLLGKALF